MCGLNRLDQPITIPLALSRGSAGDRDTRRWGVIRPAVREQPASSARAASSVSMVSDSVFRCALSALWPEVTLRRLKRQSVSESITVSLAYHL